jgi:hypothetical protein
MAAMPPRPMLPADDLYARLELPVDASFEAVEVAWRALLKRHHPDVTRAATDDLAKRINVAHDWLSDPELRARYDRERHPRPGRGRASAGGWHGRDDRRPAAAPRRRRAAIRRPLDPAEALERHLARIDRLTADEIDRLTLAETPPIAFVASIARFLSKEQLATVEAVEGRVHARLPRAVRWDPAVRDATVGYAHELVLGPFLDEHLSGDFRARVRERLTRGWEAAVDQPRYGPNGPAVAAAIDRLGRLSPAELRSIAGAAAVGGSDGRSWSPPWPPGLTPGEDDALRVSSELARRDAVGALRTTIPAAARRSLETAIHALVLRHAFPPATFGRLVGPWREAFVTDQPRPSVRSQPGRPRG